MLVPDEAITTWIDVGDAIDQKFRAIKAHVTQMSEQNPFVRFGPDAWRDFWAKEAYILRESRVESSIPETDLFAGLTADGAGRYGWQPESRLVPEGVGAS
jgi:mycothiol S-conjugate amidase